MKHFSINHFFVLSFIILLGLTLARAQDNTTIWFRVSDNFFIGDSVLLYCINDTGGSMYRDSLNICYDEVQSPPTPPSFDARWVAYAPYVFSIYGFGFSPMDIRGIPTNPAEKDTFVLKMQNGDTNAAHSNFTLTWPDSVYLHNRCDSMFLVERTGLLTDTTGKPIDTVDMFRRQSLTIFQPLQTFPTFVVWIYKYGVHLVDNRTINCIIDDARERSVSLPNFFRLEQNYPNPFNPATKISFSIPKQEFVTLRIFDLLGRGIATLVSEKKNAGVYTLPWNAGRFASGVYFYELRAGNFRQVKAMAVLK